jgi:PAS domain S-box-containing protein
VVEDNADLCAFIVDALAPRFRVSCAIDGHEGLADALAVPPDLILCEAMLPRLSAAELIAESRQHPALADVPIVVLTAGHDEELRVRLLKRGAQGFLDKPFAADELLARVGGLVDARRRARSELERYEQIVATSGDMLAFVDADRRYLVANAAYAGLVGASPAELRGRPIAEVVSAAVYARIAPRLDRCLAGEAQRFTAEGLLADGRRAVLDAEFRPYTQDGDVQGVVISVRDITALESSEAALRASEERLRLTLDVTSDGVWDWDLRSGAVYRSPRYFELVGYRPSEDTAGFEFLRSVVHPDDLPRAQDAFDAHRQGTAPAIEIDFRIVTRSGAIRWVQVHGQAVERDGAGAALRIVGTITDIGARKAAEASLHRQTAEIAARNAELEGFNRVSVGRELDMIALKREVNALSDRLGATPPYSLHFVDAPVVPASLSGPAP